VVLDAEGGPLRSELTEVSKAIETLKALGEADPSLYSAEETAATSIITEHDAAQAATDGELRRVLFEAASGLLTSGEWPHQAVCPLCGTECETDLLRRVASQLAQYSSVVETRQALRVQLEAASWYARSRKLAAVAVLRDDEHPLSTEMHIEAARGLVGADACSEAIRAVEAADVRLLELIVAKEKRKLEIEGELPPSLAAVMAQIDQARQFCVAIERLESERTRRDTASESLRRYGSWTDFIGTISKAVGDAEANLARETIEDLDGSYKQLFSAIMSVHDVVPALRRSGGRQDLEVSLEDFHGKDSVSARAVLSESYRNALAISIFLSAAVRHAGGPRFVVLDDITSSFDSGHQLRLMEELRNSLQYPANPCGVQFIMLSHDGLLEKYFDSLDSSNGWNHQRLSGWPPLGEVMASAQDGNRLRTTAEGFLKAGQIRQAQPLIRQYMEFRLQQVITKVRIPVPIDFAIKDSLKMVARSLDAIKKAVDLHVAAETIVLEPAQVSNLKGTLIPSITGNWLSHYATGVTASFTPPMLLSVLDDIDKLADCFKFDDTSGTTTTRRFYKGLDIKP